MQKNKVKQFFSTLKIAAEISQTNLIDKKYYKKQGGKGLTKLEMVKHYLEQGYQKGMDLCPYFSTDYYLQEYPDVAAAGIPPFLHFMKAGAAEYRVCHPDFNKPLAIKLIEQNGLTLKNYLEQTLELVDKNEIPISKVFSNKTRFYTAGEKQQVSSSGLFDENYYLAAYPDIARAKVDPLTHYLKFGWRENRNPSTAFDTFFVRTNYYTNATNECPLLSFTNQGNNSRSLSADSIIFESHKAFELYSKRQIAIHVHLYYPDVLKELTPLINNLDSNIDVFITTVSKYKVRRVNSLLDEADLPNKVEVLQVENIGRDLAPMFVALSDRISTYDYVCHLHSKKSPHTNFGDRWRAYLFDQLIGDKHQVDTILSTLENSDDIGLIYPDNYFEIKKFVGWNGNFSAFTEFFGSLEVDTSQVTEKDAPEFPAGSMCWFRPQSLNPLFSQAVTLANFESEDAQQEGTLAHVIERALGILPKLNNYRVVKYYGGITNVQRYANAWKPLNAKPLPARTKNLGSTQWERDTPSIALNKRLPLAPSYSFYNKDSLNIHWVIPDFGLGAGGHMTIFRMVKYLEEFGHRQTIWIQNAQNYSSPSMAKQVISENYQPIGQGVHIQFLPDQVEWISGDVIIATDCWTVFPVLAMPRFKERFYLIQDWEPMFHPVGDAHLIAELTYSLGFNALCAGDWLYAKAKEAGMWARSWKLATDKKKYFPSTDDVDNGSLLHVAFYARAYTPRRAVMLGVAALKELDRRGVKLHVSFFGEDGLNFNVSFSHEYLGVLSPNELAELYRQSDVGMVFSATNYSLIPLEMMACALPVIELDVESTRAVFDQTFIELVKPDPLQIANKLEYLASNPDEIKAKAKNALEYANSLDWKDSARTIETAILEKLEESKFVPINQMDMFDSNKQNELTASVIIPTFNAGKEFEKVIDSLLKQSCSFDYEIVIVDSGSTDQTLSIINQANSSKLRLFEIPNKEFQHGRTRNFAISKSKGEFIAVITQDALPANENWLSNLVKGFDKDAKVAGVIGAHKAYSYHSEYVKRDIFRVFERFDMFGDVYNWFFEELEPGSKDWQFALQFYSDNNSCMRRSVWEQLPYPEIDWGEDQVWAWMIVQLGLTKAYCADAIVFHSHDDTVEVREKTAKTEAEFFYKEFGLKLCDPAVDLNKAIDSAVKSETAFGQNNKLPQDVIQNQISLVKAGLAGRYAALKKED